MYFGQTNKSNFKKISFYLRFRDSESVLSAYYKA